MSGRLYFGAPKSLQMVTAAMNLKMLVPWKKSYDLNSILKSRDITLQRKFYIVKSMVFPVVMYRCESQTLKKVESAEELMLSNCGAGEDS